MQSPIILCNDFNLLLWTNFNLYLEPGGLLWKVQYEMILYLFDRLKQLRRTFKIIFNFYSNLLQIKYIFWPMQGPGSCAIILYF